MVQAAQGNTPALEQELEQMARRKFKFCVSMQRYAKFNKEEMENVEFFLQIACLDKEPAKDKNGETWIFSAVIDGHSEANPETGKRKPKFRIELPGNLILGDGKLDNQTHAIVFYRGEFLQLIDANQDNYLEECIKIRNVLREFEMYNMSGQNPLRSMGCEGVFESTCRYPRPREYIFSQNMDTPSATRWKQFLLLLFFMVRQSR